MMSRQTCPCCSNTLVRHMRLGGQYLRCSDCYQEMPVSSPVLVVENEVKGDLRELSLPLWGNGALGNTWRS